MIRDCKCKKPTKDAGVYKHAFVEGENYKYENRSSGRLDHTGLPRIDGGVYWIKVYFTPDQFDEINPDLFKKHFTT